jgi:hypothetical protein
MVSVTLRPLFPQQNSLEYKFRLEDEYAPDPVRRCGEGKNLATTGTRTLGFQRYAMKYTNIMEI